MFRTKYELDKRTKVETNPGTEIVPIRTSTLDGMHRLVVIEKDGNVRNQREYINSFEQETDIHVILNRFANGDKDALLKRAGAYIDITSMPGSLAEFTQLATEAESLFKSIPHEVKEKFNNNPLEFLATFGTDEWIKKMDTSEYAEQNAKADEMVSKSKAARDASMPAYNKNVVYGDQPINTEIPVEPIKNEESSNKMSFNFNLKGDN